MEKQKPDKSGDEMTEYDIFGLCERTIRQGKKQDACRSERGEQDIKSRQRINDGKQQNSETRTDERYHGLFWGRGVLLPVCPYLQEFTLHFLSFAQIRR